MYVAFVFIHWGPNLINQYDKVQIAAVNNLNKNEYIIIKSYSLLTNDFKVAIQDFRASQHLISTVSILNIAYLIFLGITFYQENIRKQKRVCEK